MEVRVGQKFLLGRKIGCGSFGDIHIGTDLETGEDVAVKLESVQAKTPQLMYEAKLYTLLSGSPGVVNIHWYGNEGKYNVLVMDLLGPSLEDVFDYCGCKFSLRMVLLLADQILKCIEVVHSKNYIHRDIKPDNFVLGLGQASRQVHIIDFGLAKRYRDPETRAHTPYSDGHSLTGTAEYSSINTHLGKEQSRRDDMESIGYLLLYFLRGGLPWQGMEDMPSQERHMRILRKKKSVPIEELGKHHPSEFITFMNYCRGLAFEDRPDYAYPRMIFKEIFLREGYDIDLPFDWVIHYENEKIHNEARYGWRIETTQGDELAIMLRDKKSVDLMAGGKGRLRE